MRNAILEPTTLPNLRMTPLERAMGRFMRGPEGHEGGDTSATDTSATDTTAETAATETETASTETDTETDDDTSLIGGVKGETEETEPTETDDKGKVEETDKADDQVEEEDDGLPEKYTITLPEGYEQVDETLLAEADPVFRELGLGQEQVDKLVPFVPKIQQAVQKQFVERHEALGQSWAKASKGAPDLGGDKWKDTEAHVSKALDLAAARLPDAPQLDHAGKPVVDGNGKPVMLTGKEQIAEFRALLAGTKLGNYPTMIRVFNFFGRGISEDSDFIRADGGAQVKRPREEVRYPHDAKQGGN